MYAFSLTLVKSDFKSPEIMMKYSIGAPVKKHKIKEWSSSERIEKLMTPNNKKSKITQNMSQR